MTGGISVTKVLPFSGFTAEIAGRFEEIAQTGISLMFQRSSGCAGAGGLRAIGTLRCLTLVIEVSRMG